MRFHDALILGSGFSGSLLGWILAKQGWNVMIIDSARHPRFAIGESSTPTADFLIAHLAERWDLPELAPLACWGTWKQTYPELVCGKKRGFSYYRHYEDQPYQDDLKHSQSLLVAASCEDRWSDTHWLRSSVDHFFANRAVACGATLMESTSLLQASFDRYEKTWSVVARCGDKSSSLRASWLIDASGGGAASAEFIDNPRDDQWMRTRTKATFAHYQHVQPFEAGASADDPFSGDDAAQHHVFDNGWCWMLRMDNGVTSVGIVEKLGLSGGDLAGCCQAEPDQLKAKLARYPSVATMMDGAERVAPPGGTVCTQRLSRCRSRAHADRWVLLPSAYGFIDPLHSTGIAHSLSGVARVAEALLADTRQHAGRLVRYESELRQEMRWLDTLVAGCYQALPSFPRFVAFASFYFAAAVRFEAAMATDAARWPAGFLNCNDPSLARIVEMCYRRIKDDSLDDHHFLQLVREQIAPINTVGLLEPGLKNRLHHTSAPKYASGLLG